MTQSLITLLDDYRVADVKIVGDSAILYIESMTNSDAISIIIEIPTTSLTKYDLIDYKI